MFILTRKPNEEEKTENVILEIAQEVGKQENGNYLLDPLHDEDNNGRVAIPEQFIEKVVEVEEIPEGVEPYKYCYSEEDGFYKNPDYKKYYSTEERLEMVEQMMNELILGEE